MRCTSTLARDGELVCYAVSANFRLLNVQNALLVNHKPSGDAIGSKYDAKHLFIEPEIVTAWNAGADNNTVRRIFATV